MEGFLEFPAFSKETLRIIKKTIDATFREFSRNYGDSVETLFYPIKIFLLSIQQILVLTPWPLIMLAFVVAIFYFTKNKKLCAWSIFYMLFIGAFGLWDATMYTLSLVIVSTILCIVIGIPIGVLMAKFNKAERIINPILDVMQTIPIFVYLIPVVMLLGLGLVPGLISMSIYAIPPIIRLTNLGIRQVDRGVIEAALALGLTPFVILHRIELPLAIKSVLAGANQTIMMAIAMVVIASMIGVQGLGTIILQAVQNQYIGAGIISGIAVVGLAVVLDRVIQNIKK